jgi:hypothetical protein
MEGSLEKKRANVRTFISYYLSPLMFLAESQLGEMQGALETQMKQQQEAP